MTQRRRLPKGSPPKPMNGISWKCRGLGNPSTVQELTRIINLKKPDFVFMMETKLSHAVFDPLLFNLGFDFLHVVDCDSSHGGKRGGLCILWKDSLNLHITSYSCHHIDAEVRNQFGIPEWRLTDIYGWAEDQMKSHTWQLIRELGSGNNIEWLCFGDFNDIIFSSEKFGGNLRSQSKLAALKNAIDECGLEDLGFSGHHFTWTNWQSEADNIQERLDRFLANQVWAQTFLSHSVEHLVRFQSAPSKLNGAQQLAEPADTWGKKCSDLKPCGSERSLVRQLLMRLGELTKSTPPLQISAGKLENWGIHFGVGRKAILAM